MSDDDRTGTGSESEDESGSTSDSDAAEEASVEIPISSGEGDRENETAEEGVEIEVKTGSPDPDVESESSVAEGTSSGDAGTGGLFDRLDRSLLDVLSRGLDGETHVRVYLAVRNRPWSTPKDVAGEAELYPRAARDALETLEAHGALERRGPAAGIDPSREPEYAARDPGAVLADAIGGDGRKDTNGLDLGRYFDTKPATEDSSPIRIDVEDKDDTTDAGANDDGAGTTDTDASSDPDSEDRNREGDRSDGES
ncbi:hypothetical protein BRC86_03765 [Halobacteriales archaeon QS_3_64_16]|nr:MAG: hypothetical protein BRC86_03765 [Halobacteriales archaeon QS_3_64_16]